MRDRRARDGVLASIWSNSSAVASILILVAWRNLCLPGRAALVEPSTTPSQSFYDYRALKTNCPDIQRAPETEQQTSNSPKELESRLQYKIMICAMARNTVPFIVEWILFHIIQGVEHFILYDDTSEDDLTLLPQLFQSWGYCDLVRVVPANFHRRNHASTHDYADHYGNQLPMLDHCNNRAKNMSQWLLLIDTDEFAFSPNEGTLAKFLAVWANKTNPLTAEQESITGFKIEAIRYGTSGVKENMHGGFYRDPSSQAVILSYENANSTNKFPLTITASRRRGPHPALDADYDSRHKNICSAKPGPCGHAMGKYLYKPRFCHVPDVHFCKNRTGQEHWASLFELRLAHYAFRSAEHVNSFNPNLYGPKTEAYQLYDVTWFSLLDDVSPGNYSKFVLELIQEDKVDSFFT